MEVVFFSSDVFYLIKNVCFNKTGRVFFKLTLALPMNLKAWSKAIIIKSIISYLFGSSGLRSWHRRIWFMYQPFNNLCERNLTINIAERTWQYSTFAFAIRYIWYWFWYIHLSVFMCMFTFTFTQEWVHQILAYHTCML